MQLAAQMYLDSGEYVGTAYVQEKPPYNTVIGEVRPRGGVNGLILRGGRIVAEWGDTRRTDMTFSCAKSYIALVAGLAFDRALLSLDDRVADSVPDEGFASPHNRAITWRHLLQQTSEWQGVLWDKPDSVDHNRQVGLGNDNSRKGEVRALEPAGHALRVQRRAGEPARAVAAPAVAPAAAGGAARRDHGPDRRVGQLGVARHRTRRSRSTARASNGLRRRPLGRRIVHLRAATMRASGN